MDIILRNLKESIQYNAELIGGVKDNFKEFWEGLETLGAIIREYTEKYTEDEILETFASQIRAVVYRAEDVIEKYISCASVQKLRNDSGNAVHLADYISDVRAVGKDIENLIEYVRHIYQNGTAHAPMIARKNKKLNLEGN